MERAETLPVRVPARALQFAQAAVCFRARRLARFVVPRHESAIVAREPQIPPGAPRAQQRIDVIVPAAHPPEALEMILVVTHICNGAARREGFPRMICVQH
jgi:hypothetical protein